MKKLYLNTDAIPTIFNDLKDSLDGTLVLKDNQYSLKVKSKKANGNVSGSMLSKQIAYIEFDIFFHDDIVLSLESSVNSPILFTYCSEGIISHSFGINGEVKNIKPNHTGILRNTSNINSVLFFKGCTRIKSSIIWTNVSSLKASENKDLVIALKTMFTNTAGRYIHIAQSNFGIAEKINEFKNVPQKGIVGNLLRKKIVENILETEHMLHSYGYSKTIQPIWSLATKRVEELKRISNLNILEVFYGMKQAGNYLPRFLKGKYHLAFNHTIKN